MYPGNGASPAHTGRELCRKGSHRRSISGEDKFAHPVLKEEFVRADAEAPGEYRRHHFPGEPAHRAPKSGLPMRLPFPS